MKDFNIDDVRDENGNKLPWADRILHKCAGFFISLLGLILLAMLGLVGYLIYAVIAT